MDRTVQSNYIAKGKLFIIFVLALILNYVYQIAVISVTAGVALLGVLARYLKRRKSPRPTRKTRKYVGRRSRNSVRSPNGKNFFNLCYSSLVILCSNVFSPLNSRPNLLTRIEGLCPFAKSWRFHGRSIRSHVARLRIDRRRHRPTDRFVTTATGRHGHGSLGDGHQLLGGHVGLLSVPLADRRRVGVRSGNPESVGHRLEPTRAKRIVVPRSAIGVVPEREQLCVTEDFTGRPIRFGSEFRFGGKFCISVRSGIWFVDCFSLP